ncbi:putative transmembrane ascorbate-dependent reductase CYB561 homolog isoform X1 [Argiope bruennichi]|uniref:Putative cytochrome b561 like protein n=1 Tax=Argiope bruennichi TaxID=94029 RepID=A0A8T0G1Y2_ARGBR|nr:putative transmembrane ascorbate-dependent reductase CYB561 homolog isoform X1 [Argiope bruennichi]KAF8796448.1 putative cytochrome b561 like protein [Argiope bruennichi]
MEYHSRKEYQIIYGLITVLGILNVALVLIWTKNYLGGFAWQEDPLHQFNYHPVCAIVGLVVLYGKGLLLYRTLYYRGKATLKLLHTATMIITFALAVISLKCVFDSHDYRTVPIPNLYSLHSWIGLGTVILFASQLFCGFVAFLYPGVKSSLRKIYLQYHQFFGTIIFILAVLSCHSGIMEKVKASLGKEYLSLHAAAYIANFLGVSITIFAVLVLYLLFIPQFKRRPLPEEDKICFELHENVS